MFDIVFCGCYILVNNGEYYLQPQYLPLVDTHIHSTVIGTSSRTALTQTFVAPNTTNLVELRYSFPLFDGVSVVSFKCTVGGKQIEGVVKEKDEAREAYDKAKDRGETAGLFAQNPDASDTFTTTIGNVPAGAKVVVTIEYLGELKHDAQVDGLRFTVPARIAPRYGALQIPEATNVSFGNFKVTVDVEISPGSAIKAVQSPSHAVAVSIGTTSKAADAEPSFRKASATLTLGSTILDKDFVLQVVATNLGEPTALLETHPTIPNQLALMATLAPKFNLTPTRPEIVFICDRSGSMRDNIPALKQALHVFLKSLPVGVKFNICSFGWRFSFLWEKSQSYSATSLKEATSHVETFAADFGGTEMVEPVRAAFKQRFPDLDLEVFLLTDGAIGDQKRLFKLINTEYESSNGTVRVFTLGIGSGASTSLVEGAARAGRAFAQVVADREQMDKKIVRMLKGALFPHITDYTLELEYDQDHSLDDDEFVLVEKIQDALVISNMDEKPKQSPSKNPISLFNREIKDDDAATLVNGPQGKFDHLPEISTPKYLQTPMEIPPLFPFSRTTVYILLNDIERVPRNVILRATSAQGPLELSIPVTALPEPTTTIHQLAARKEVLELEEGRGWITQAQVSPGTLLRDAKPSQFDDMVQREAVRLGVKYQIAGKWTSFVAVEKKTGEKDILLNDGQKDQEPNYDFAFPDQSAASPLAASHSAGIMAARATGAAGFAGGGFGAGGGVSYQQQQQMPSNASPRPEAVRYRGAPPPPSAYAGHPPSYEGTPARAPRARRSANAQTLQGQQQQQQQQLIPSQHPCGSLGSEALFGAARETGSLSSEALFGAAPDTGRSGGYGSGAYEFAPKPVDRMQELTRLQTFEGSWEWSADLEKVLGIKLGAAQAAAGGVTDQNALATACAIAFFRKRLARDAEAWEMMVDKAEMWLAGSVKGHKELVKAMGMLF